MRQAAADSDRASDAALPGLYLHVPFCSAICPYCDFAVLTGGAEKRRRFVASILTEIALWADSGWRGFDTIYFGGGTPSALAPEQIGEILDRVYATFPESRDARIFLEANPEDASAESFAALRALEVATLSLGVQTFEPEELAFLGRRHTPEQGERAFHLAREAGFPTVSLDLIFGLPDQTPATWRRSLEAAVRLGADHISCYQLTIHEGTPFGFRRDRGHLAEMPEPAQAEIFHLTHQLLGDAGYEGYEVSNFALTPQHRSRHNQKYWRHVPYLGLGPSAHSFDGERRWWNERKLGPWEANIDQHTRPIADSEVLTPANLALEALMLGLRTKEGLDLGLFRERYGVDLEARNAELLDRAILDGMLVREGESLKPTLGGFAVADGLARDFEVGE
ncbi:MAG TPA: radical SAM family heme chaperone HemW [Thermoanaerobaculia bacterium]|jgi:oxygen-independent coproporphyrinogen-3 oxidase|nr:radical SAM family heme chaperone HemW [Thermoanaerobaculia bacterium]